MKQKIKWGKTKTEETAEEEERSPLPPVSFSIPSISCEPFYFPHFTATYTSLLDGFPASKFSLAYFNPEKGESK